MAKKTKRVRKKIRKRVESKKTNKYIFYLVIVVLIAVFLYFVFYSMPNQLIQPSGSPADNQITTNEPSNQPIEQVVRGGSCNKDSECFITSCKGQTRDCVNTNQLSSYSRNCRTYSEWVVEKQDASTCACVQNACTMIK